MEVDLKSLDDVISDQYCCILHILDGILSYPLSLEARSTYIANTIVFFCKNVQDDDAIREVFEGLWTVVFESSCLIPPDHDWQQCLVLAITKLRETEGSASENNVQAYVWSDLPDLEMELVEHWQRGPHDSGEIWSGRLSHWENVNSFLSHLVGSGYHQARRFGVWELVKALEISPSQPVIDCRLWVATEWILNAGPAIYRHIVTADEQISDGEFRSLRTGPLADKIERRSKQRWDFWKQRFAEISKDVELCDKSVKRIEEALRKMESLEQ